MQFLGSDQARLFWREFSHDETGVTEVRFGYQVEDGDYPWTWLADVIHGVPYTKREQPIPPHLKRG